MYVLISPGYRLRSVISEFSIVFYSGCANIFPTAMYEGSNFSTILTNTYLFKKKITL